MDPQSEDRMVIAVLDRLNINLKGPAIQSYQEYLVDVVNRLNDLMDHEQKADAAFKAEQFKEALANYEVAMHLSGLVYRFHANRGVSLLLKRARTYLALNDFSHAYLDAKTCLSIDRSIEPYMVMIEVLIGLKAFKQALQYSTAVIDRVPEHKGVRQLHERVLLELQKVEEQSGGFKIRYNKDQLLKKFALVRPHLRGRANQLERFKEKAMKAVVIGFVPGLKKQRGLFAAKDFAPGTTIIKEHKPVVFSTLAFDDSCQWCLRLLGSGQVSCQHCFQEKYCCDQCRTSAWNDYHEGMCGVAVQELAMHIKSNRDNSTPENLHALMALRMVGKEATYNIKNQTQLSAWELPHLELYYSALPIQSTEKRYPDIVDNYKLFRKALRTARQQIDPEHFSFEWYLRVLGIMQQYSVVYKSFKHKSSGGDTCGIYPLSSFINHRCTPNAQIGFVNNTIVITALTDVQEGEQLFVDYFANLAPNTPRNPLLEAVYGFKCTCSKCMRRAAWK